MFPCSASLRRSPIGHPSRLVAWVASLMWLAALGGEAAAQDDVDQGATSDGRSKPAVGAVAPSGDETFFADEVAPLLKKNCLKCHGESKRVKGGLRLTSRDDVLAGGDSGPAVDLQRPSASLLLRAVSYEDDNLQMPPKRRLAPEEVAVLVRWVEGGVAWTATASGDTARSESDEAHAALLRGGDHWAFQPVVQPAVPEVKDDAWIRHPIDAFILRRLEDAALKPAAPAAKSQLLRRVYFDLIGLPPTPTQVRAFLADEASDAFERVVDDLLDSPHYGERWARHWLDVVRFAETNSFERDGAKPFAWRYRDYVIESLNADKPYDQFVREQLAGDELDDVTPETIIATGFYRLGPWDDEPTDEEQAIYDELDDIVSTTGQAFLGLTVNCARCHDHKLDPIPQSDYYRLLAFFRGVSPTKRRDGDSLLTIIAPAAERASYERANAELESRRKAARDRFEVFREGMVALLSDAERTAIAADPGKRGEILKQRLPELLTTSGQEKYEALREHYEKVRREKPPAIDRALSVKETGPQPPSTHILIRGSAHIPGDEVAPGFPVALKAPRAAIPEVAADAKTSGRRRVLAEWIASADNPMTARVIVNRIWQHHFGRGIVRSPNNFGRNGVPPTHPKLLDWLAADFVRHGWRIKRLHRLIVTSSAYRMSSGANAKALAEDPENQLFWRMNMRRLSAEEVRDALLYVNGTLNLKVGGPSVFPKIPAAILQGQSRPGNGWTFSSEDEQRRRSVYVHIKRSLILPIFETFDYADTDASCPVRFATTQPTQALTMLNSEFMQEQAASFAARLGREAGDERRAQVDLALNLALSRRPTDVEIRRGLDLIVDLGANGVEPSDALRLFCLTVLNLNEFLYLD